MNLSQWAEQVGVSKFTAYRWFREGNLPVPARRVGRLILVDAPGPESGRTVIYARVSTHDQRKDLDRQVARLTGWLAEQELSVDEVITEVGSGLTGKRKRLARLLADPTAARIVVEHADRLARFEFTHLEAALAAQGRKVLVAEPGQVDDQDLLRDMTDALSVYCARTFGAYGARNRAEKALRCAKNDVGPAVLEPTEASPAE
ncbi:MAG TPA: IS607 family transposase [Actinomycetota bacterium]|nr:IS607 family transposase [Actinomycetota bacterium]